MQEQARATQVKPRGDARPVIYDFGMNNGDDVEYYLLKNARVVGVEANAALCETARHRFSREIASGQLTILNLALSDRQSAEPLTFYIHKTNHVLSQLPKPDEASLHEFEPVRVPSRTPSSIVRKFGPPLYIKIDVEHFDLNVLRQLFAAGIRPPEISAESHSIAVFACLVENGYKRFSLVDGWTVPKLYGNATVATPGGPRAYSFPKHSAGPFGVDIRSQWSDADEFFLELAKAGLGWKDIHARF